MMYDQELKTLEATASTDAVLADYMESVVAELKQPADEREVQRVDPLVGMWAALGICLVMVVKAGVDRWRGENELDLTERRLEIIDRLKNDELTQAEATSLVERVIDDIRGQPDDSELIKSVMLLQSKLQTES